MNDPEFPWPTVPLGKLAAEMCLGKMLDKLKNRGTLQPYLRNVNVRWFSFDLTDMKEMRFEESEGGRFQLRPGDLVICEGGEPGRTAVWKGQVETAKIQKALHRVRFHPDEYDPTFAMYFLYFGTMTNRFASSYTGTTIKHLTGAALSQVHFPVAPLAEQRRIVAKIDDVFAELDAAVVELERVRANLKRYRASVLKAAVTGELTADWRATRRELEPASVLLARILTDRRAKWEADQRANFAAAGKSPPKDWQAKYAEPPKPDTTTLPAVPEGWCWTNLSQLIEDIRGGTSFKCITRKATLDEWAVIKVSAMTWGTFLEDENKVLPPHTVFDPTDEIRLGDLLLSRCNTPELVGASVLVGDCRQRLLLSDKSLRLLTHVFIDKNWLHKALSSPILRRQLSGMATGTSNSMRNVSHDKIESVTVPLPPLAEQEAIVMEVEARLSDVAAAEAVVAANLKRAARLRQSVLKEAFAGRLVPQDPADEPATALLDRLRAAKPNPAPTARGRKAKGEATTVYEAIIDFLSYTVPSELDAGRLNRTKIQKFGSVLQAHSGVEIVDYFRQDQYGPHAREISDMEAVCGQRGYFTTTENPKGAKGHEYEYTPGPNAEAGRAAGLKRLGVHATAAAALLRVIRGMTTDEAELFATVHAVWNDLLIDGKPPDESAIVKGVHAWNPSKRKFSETTIVECIAWIRTNGYVPTGRGKRTVEAKPSVKRAGGDCG